MNVVYANTQDLGDVFLKIDLETAAGLRHKPQRLVMESNYQDDGFGELARIGPGPGSVEQLRTKFHIIDEGLL